MVDVSHHNSFASVLTGVNIVRRRIFFILDNRKFFLYQRVYNILNTFQKGPILGLLGKNAQKR